MAFTPSENPITHPERESYTELRPFRFWCQKVLPLVYDNSLSYYELLCKVVDYLNKTMEDVDHMNTDMDTLYSNFQEFQEGTIRIYNELVAYVNAYFENLDVQEEINTKLDEMVTSGELVTILQPSIASEVASWLNDHITPTSPAIDDTLTVSGAAADAKTTGDLITDLNSNLDEFIKNSMSFESPLLYTIPNAGILADGTIYELDNRNVYVAVVSGFNEISVSRGELYSLFKTKPTIGSKGTNRITMSGPVNVTIPEGYGYIAVRDTTQPVFTSLDTSTILYILKNVKQIADKLAVCGAGRSITPSNIPSGLTDLNNLGTGYNNNSIIRLSGFNSENSVLHAPVIPFNGTIISMSVSSEAIFGIQLAFAERTNKTWYRYFISGFTDTYDWTDMNPSESVTTVTTPEELFNALRSDPGGIINIMPGEYDLYTGLFEPLILNDSIEYAWITKDTIINGSGATIKCHIPQSVAESHTVSANLVSLIDIKGNVTVNDLNFDCINTRYCIHYESMGDAFARFDNVNINNCHFKYTRNVSNLNASCIGIGASAGQHFNIKNCTFENNIKYGIYIHGRDYGIGSLNLENCIINASDGGLFLSQYTGLATPTDVYIVNSNVGNIIQGGQSGGTGESQYRVFIINSNANIIVDNVEVLYPTTVINTIPA